MTGCLQKGDAARKYSITSEDSKRYGLRSKTVSLAKRVGHKVTVTGTQVREENEQKERKKREAASTRISGAESKRGSFLIFQKQERLIHLHITVLDQHLRAAGAQAQ